MLVDSDVHRLNQFATQPSDTLRSIFIEGKYLEKEYGKLVRKYDYGQ
jgi:hypothetical protein